MKKIFALLFLIASTSSAFSQTKWFTLYPDSTSLVTDGNAITKQFTQDLLKLKPDLAFDVKTILNTTPYLIYFYDDGKVKTANLPIWSQVIQPQKEFFYEVSGSQSEGEKAFGLFFNGFYLPHELGHALEKVTKGNIANSYESEYFANTVAILWWKKNGREKELKSCYEMAKRIFAKLPNPVPAGTSIEEYFTKNYEQASTNPYTYGYMQFRQFIEIYENKKLSTFDDFVKQYLAKK